MQQSAFTRLVQQELVLMLKGRSLWWQLIMLGMGIAQFLVSTHILISVIVPAMWLGGIFVFSSLGQREVQYRVQPLIFCHRAMMSKQFPAMLAAGFLFALLCVSPAIIRMSLTGNLFTL